MGSVVTLLATIVPLGIAAAMHPALLGLQLLIVGQTHWWRRARAFALGASIPLVLFGILVFLGFSQLPEPRPGSFDIWGISLRTVIGLGFLAASVWLFLPHPQLQQRTAEFVSSKVASGRPADFFALGLIMNGKSLTSYALLVPALHDIAQTREVALQLAALALLYVLALSTLWIPILVALLLGTRGASTLQRASTYVIDHNFRILAVTALLIGVYLTGSAAVLIALVDRL